MPFDMWCATCGELHPRGRRFNAEKKEVDSYLSTKIYAFRFKCNACFNKIEIRTDPANADFIVTEGGRRRAEASESDETNENLPKTKSKEDREREADPFARLERVHDDVERGKAAVPVLEEIREATERKHADSVQKNRLLRSLARSERKRAQALETEAQQRGLGIALLPTTIEDETEAHVAMLQAKQNRSKLQRTVHDARRAHASSSIFSSSSPSKSHQQQLLDQLKQKKVNVGIFRKK